MKKVVAIALSILFLAAILYKANLAAVFNSIRSIDSVTLAISLILIVANLLVVALRLQRILHHFQSRVSFFVAFHASLSGLIASLFLINVVGSVLGRQVVLRLVGVSAALSTFISGYERLILALIGGILGASGGIYLAGNHMLNDLFVGLPLLPIVVSLAVIGVGVAVTSRSSFERDVIRRLRNPRRLLEVSEIFIISAVSQLLNIYIYTLIISSMGFDLPFLKVMAASAMVSFAASVPISVNGWGVREISSIYAFGLLGVDASTATAVSIAVGLLNTIVVVVAAPVFAFSRRVFAVRVQSRKDAIMSTNAREFSEIHSKDQLDFQKISSFSLGIFLPILLFFQFPVNVSGTTLTLNLGDIFALLGLGLLASQTSFGGLLNFRLSRDILLWLAMISVAVYLSLLIGIFRYGPIPWAIGNRGIGWLVVLGYFGSGALFTGQFGRKGLRRLTEVLLLTAAVVATVHLSHRIAYALDWTSLAPPPNFEGFSANRNAFAFQLIVVLGLTICYLLPVHKVDWLRLGPPMAIVVFAAITTNSLTAYICLGCMTIVIATARKDLAVRALLIALGGAALYVILPYALTVLRYAPYYTDVSWAWIRNFFLPTGQPNLAALPADANFREIFQHLPTDRMVGNEDSSVTERLESLRGGVELWHHHPIFGAGLGAFISTQISKTGTPLVIHSTYVWIIAEMGLVGLLLTGWIPLKQIHRLWRDWRRRPKRIVGGLNKNNSAIILLTMTFCVFSLAHEIGYQRIFWFVLGALLAGPGQTALKEILPSRNAGLKGRGEDRLAEAES